MMGAVQLSAEAIGRLQLELEQLRGPRRGQLRDAVLAARQMGSIVENGDYAAAKEEERLVEDRIAHLEDLLRRAEQLPEAEDGVVAVGRQVTVRFGGDTDCETYLFGEAAEKSQWPVCTPQSPLGRALNGRRAGDRVQYQTPSGASIAVAVVAVG